MGHGNQLGLGSVFGHIRVIGNGIDAFFLGGQHRCCGIGMMSDNVCALGDERLRSLTFLARIKPGVHPDHLDFNIRIHRFRPQCIGVDAPDDLGDRKGGNIAQGI